MDLDGPDRRVMFPCWLSVLLTAAPPAAWLRGRLRRRRATRLAARGYCPDCGYDLRGSRHAGRCPECGRGAAADVATPALLQTA